MLRHTSIGCIHVLQDSLQTLWQAPSAADGTLLPAENLVKGVRAAVPLDVQANTNAV